MGGGVPLGPFYFSSPGTVKGNFKSIPRGLHICKSDDPLSLGASHTMFPMHKGPCYRMQSTLEVYHSYVKKYHMQKGGSLGVPSADLPQASSKLEVQSGPGSGKNFKSDFTPVGARAYLTNCMH